MSTQEFDPTKFGATPFDPSQYGATPAESPKSESTNRFDSADYVKSSKGFILNPRNPNAKVNGPVNVLDTSTGKSYDLTIDPKSPAEIVPGLIEGHIRSKEQPTLLDRIKSKKIIAPLPGLGNVDTGHTIGSIIEGFTGSPANTPQSDLTPGQSLIRGMDTEGSRFRDAIGGTLKSAAIMGGGGVPAAVEAGKQALNIPAAIKSALYSAPKELIGGAMDFASGGDPTRMQQGAADVSIQTLPAVYQGVKTAQALPAALENRRLAVAEQARVRSVNHLGEVVAPGVEGPPQYAAEASQPFAKQFLHEAGVDPKEILPKTGASPDLLRGGTPEQLARVNNALKAEFVRTGGDAADFVPAKSVTMGIADGLVNVADRPISNAVAAVATHEIPEVQASIEAKLRSAANVTPDSSLASALDKVADLVKERGGTAIGIDNLKSYLNKESAKFYRGTPSAQSNAMATSAYAYKYAADAIREDFYPWLEKNTTATGIADAGRAEAAAIASRDGIYKSWTRAAKLDANAGVQKFWDYVANGPEGLAQGALKPATTTAGIVARTAGYPFREMPLGRFNEIFQTGLGDMRNYSPIDSAVMATTAPGVRGGYPRIGTQPGYSPTQGKYELPEALRSKEQSSLYGEGPRTGPTQKGPGGNASGLIPEKQTPAGHEGYVVPRKKP